MRIIKVRWCKWKEKEEKVNPWEEILNELMILHKANQNLIKRTERVFSKLGGTMGWNPLPMEKNRFRPLKFRAWCKQKERMYYIDLFSHLDLAEKYAFEAIPTTAKINGLMQFTGCKDKKNKEIYEGDIIKFEKHDDVIVEWNEKNSQFVGKIIKTMEDKYPTYCSFFGYNLYEEHEIIGNVWENYQLVEKKQ